MKTLTKDEIQHLTSDQQQAICNLEAQRILLRQQLVERTQRYRSMDLVTGLGLGLAGVSRF